MKHSIVYHYSKYLALIAERDSIPFWRIIARKRVTKKIRKERAAYSAIMFKQIKKMKGLDRVKF